MTILHEVATTPSRTISTTELRDRLGDPDLTIIDTRSLTAYNGWRLDGEARGEGAAPGWNPDGLRVLRLHLIVTDRSY